MTISPIIAPLAVALVAAGTITASATGALAATPASPAPTSSATSSTSGQHHEHLGKDATLQQIQAAGASATATRISRLNAAVTKVDADKTLTSGDRSAVLLKLQNGLTGMQHLQSSLAGDTTAAQARTDYTAVFAQYRVVAVVLPQERIVREAHRVTSTTLPHLQAAEKKLSDRLTTHAAADSTAAKTALADLQKQIATVQSDNQGLDAAALAVTPAQYDQAHTAISSVTSTATALKSAVAAARKDMQTIRQALHG
ncbi:hypothetical protein ACPEEZ_12245 [Frigoribacterium sp. 2-23]|uniref:hypothetical protein n=1 Tax=Frigoribacterium sp. 2-23 TaxID=3415006 RepID=UPI003C6FB93C